MNDHACCINRAEGSVSGTPGQTDTRTCSKAVPLPRLLNIYLQRYGVTVTVFHVCLACSLKIRNTPCLFFIFYFSTNTSNWWIIARCVRIVTALSGSFVIFILFSVECTQLACLASFQDQMQQGWQFEFVLC